VAAPVPTVAVAAVAVVTVVTTEPVVVVAVLLLLLPAKIWLLRTTLRFIWFLVFGPCHHFYRRCWTFFVTKFVIG
jgi:hypothetical protein